MPFFNNHNIGNLNNVQPLVEEEEKKSSTFLTSSPIEEQIEQPTPQPFGFLSSAPAQMEPQTILVKLNVLCCHSVIQIINKHSTTLKVTPICLK